MNIFYLSHDTKECAKFHNDRHTVKMILEYAQLLSTAHRVIDGYICLTRSDSGRKKTTYKLDDSRDGILYSATHVNHPSAIWCRVRESHYRWLFGLWIDLMEEYSYRYGKNHACERLISSLSSPPKNIEFGGGFDEPTPAMPDDVKIKGDSLKSYRNYYIKNKAHLASWKQRTVPYWYSQTEL